MHVFTVRAKNWHGARDLSRRNAGPADPRWEIAMPFRQPIFQRTKLRAPIAVRGETVSTYWSMYDDRPGRRGRQRRATDMKRRRHPSGKVNLGDIAAQQPPLV